MASSELTLFTKSEAYVYKLSASSSSSSGWSATTWNLSKPDWSGRIRVVCSDSSCIIRLEPVGVANVSNECVVHAFPGPSVETVSDSSRYFVLHMRDNTPLGLGFSDRSDSFDFNACLLSHFKKDAKEEAESKGDNDPKLDLALKEGETIKVSINLPRKNARERSRSPAVANSRVAKLPPPNLTQAMAEAGIDVNAQPKIAAPPAKPSNPNWIQF